ncbi:DUF86 domain-containing protein [bacterium]|nr:DUF86 domain-containing protein [bacterium]
MRDALEFLEGKGEKDFRADKQLRYALERAILIMGEASKLVSEEFQQGHGGVPWRRLIRLRNSVAHNYGPETISLVWEGLRILPQAELQLKSILPNEYRNR